MPNKAKNYDGITKVVIVLSVLTLCMLAIAAWRDSGPATAKPQVKPGGGPVSVSAAVEIDNGLATAKPKGRRREDVPLQNNPLQRLPVADRHALAPVVATPPGYDIDVEIDEALLLILKQESDYCRDPKAHGNYWQTTEVFRKDCEERFGFYPHPADFETTMKAVRLWLKYYAPIYGAVTAADMAKMYNLGPTGFRRWKFKQKRH